MSSTTLQGQKQSQKTGYYFAQYHAPQTAAMNEHILKELSTPALKIRVMFATVAMGMGVDIPAIRHVIHVGPPCTVREYFQETGRASAMGNSLLQHCTTTIETLPRIV